MVLDGVRGLMRGPRHIGSGVGGGAAGLTLGGSGGGTSAGSVSLEAKYSGQCGARSYLGPDSSRCSRAPGAGQGSHLGQRRGGEGRGLQGPLPAGVRAAGAG